MIKLELNVTLKQFSAIAAIITPSQLLAMSKILETTPVVPEDRPKDIKHPKTDNESLRGFVRPTASAAVLDGAIIIVDEVDPPLPVQEHSTIVATAATRKRGGGKGPKMPSFGRTQAQVDKFVEHEATRTEELDEEEELKKQRAEERASKRAEKDAIEAEKKLEDKQAQDEVNNIKAKELANSKEVETKLAPKPWNLKGSL